MVTGAGIHAPPYGPGADAGDPRERAAGVRRWAYRRAVELIDAFAGFHATASRACVHPNMAALMGGRGDPEHYRAVVDGWVPGVEPGTGDAEYDVLEGRVAAWARTLVRSPMGRAAIHTVAEALFAHGHVAARRAADL